VYVHFYKIYIEISVKILFVAIYSIMYTLNIIPKLVLDKNKMLSFI